MRSWRDRRVEEGIARTRNSQEYVHIQWYLFTRRRDERREAGKQTRVTFGRGNVDISGHSRGGKAIVEQARKEFRRKGGGGCEMQARMQRWCGESGPVSGLRSLFIPTLLRAVDGSWQKKKKKRRSVFGRSKDREKEGEGKIEGPCWLERSPRFCWSVAWPWRSFGAPSPKVSSRIRNSATSTSPAWTAKRRRSFARMGSCSGTTTLRRSCATSRPTCLAGTELCFVSCTISSCRIFF